jgi:hypothetical protein
LPGRNYTAAEVDAAVEAISDPERIAHAQDVVAHLAPQLQRILAEALEEGGYFGNAHEAELKRLSGGQDPVELRVLVAEEARLGMLVGVAVGFELARELENQAKETP